MLDFAAGQAENGDQYQVDYSRINDPTVKDEDAPQLVTCTPVMAPRDLKGGVPETPWLKSNKLDPTNATPVMKGAIMIRKAHMDKENYQNCGGVAIKRPEPAKAKGPRGLAIPAIPERRGGLGPLKTGPLGGQNGGNKQVGGLGGLSRAMKAGPQPGLPQAKPPMPGIEEEEEKESCEKPAGRGLGLPAPGQGLAHMPSDGSQGVRRRILAPDEEEQQPLAPTD